MPELIKKKLDAWQGSEYSSNSEYARILNMTVLHNVLKKCCTIDAWQDSEYSSGFEYEWKGSKYASVTQGFEQNALL